MAHVMFSGIHFPVWLPRLFRQFISFQRRAVPCLRLAVPAQHFVLAVTLCGMQAHQHLTCRVHPTTRRTIAAIQPLSQSIRTPNIRNRLVFLTNDSSLPVLTIAKVHRKLWLNLAFRKSTDLQCHLLAVISCWKTTNQPMSF